MGSICTEHGHSYKRKKSWGKLIPIEKMPMSRKPTQEATTGKGPKTSREKVNLHEEKDADRARGFEGKSLNIRVTL